MDMKNVEIIEGIEKVKFVSIIHPRLQ